MKMKESEKIILALGERGGLTIENIRISETAGHADITIDSPEPVTVSVCAQFCTLVQNELEKQGLNYSVTVSSPGAYEPFRKPFQFKKNVGREITAFLTDGQTFSGKLTQAGDTGYTIENISRVPKEKGKGKISRKFVKEISYQVTQYAKVNPKF